MKDTCFVCGGEIRSYTHWVHRDGHTFCNDQCYYDWCGIGPDEGRDDPRDYADDEEEIDDEEGIDADEETDVDDEPDED